MEFLCKTILPISKTKAKKRDKVNILVTLVRNLITLPYVPMYSYSKGSSKADIICQYYYANISNKDAETELQYFLSTIYELQKFYDYCENENPILHKNKLFYEVLYWGIVLVKKNKV